MKYASDSNGNLSGNHVDCSINGAIAMLNKQLKQIRVKKRRFEMKNPYVLIIGNEFYNDPKQVWRSLNGVICDVANMDYLWRDVYGYHNTKILFSPRKRNKSEFEQLCQRGDNTQCYYTEYFENNFKNGYYDLKNRQSFISFLDIVVEKINRNPEYDGLILHYSGHGIHKSIILGDATKDSIAEIEDKFNGYNCKQLLGKPKLMIFDCCVGSKYAQMIKGEGDEDEEKEKEKILNFNNRSVLNNKNCVNYMGNPVPKPRGCGMYGDSDIEGWHHPYEGFAFIFSNSRRYTINDGANGGYLTNAIYKILTEEAQWVSQAPTDHELISLRDLIVDIRNETANYAGKGSNKTSAQLVDFHETLPYHTYFG